MNARPTPVCASNTPQHAPVGRRLAHSVDTKFCDSQRCLPESAFFQAPKIVVGIQAKVAFRGCKVHWLQ